MNILHLTHTDINTDSRILKEMLAIAGADDPYHVSGIGVRLDEGSAQAKNIDKLSIDSILLRSREWKFLPTPVRHLCSLIELTTKMVKRAIRTKPQVVHCHDTLVLPLGAIVKLFSGAKLIYDAHELESDRNGLTKGLGKITLFVEKILWRYVDSLIVVSPSIQNWYMNNLGEKYSKVILNSPILQDNTADGSKYLREHFSIPKESKIFLYIGILAPGRGIDLIVDAFSRSDIDSSMIFLGYGQLAGDLKQIASKHDNIYVHDAVPHEEVVNVAKSADVGLCFIQNVSLSDYYSLPNKLFEYCFAGIPVLASDFPDISKIVKEYNLGKCSDLDSRSIYEKVKEFEKLDKIPKVDIDSLYNLSWEAQANKLIELYDNIKKD